MKRRAGNGHTLTQVQAEAIGRLQLIQLVGLEIDRLVNEYREVVDEIEGYEAILRDENLMLDIIREDILEIKEKYGDERRTQITGEVSEFNMDALIAAEDVVVTVSHEGYIKRLPVGTYRAGPRRARYSRNRIAEGDFVEQIFIGNTHHYLLFFTNAGRVYERRVYDVPEMSRTSQGRAIANLLELQQGEKVANVLVVEDFTRQEQFLMFATAKGVVKKTALSAYGNIRQNGIIAIGLEEGDSLIDVKCTSGKDHVILGTKSGLAIRFDEADVARWAGRRAVSPRAIARRRRRRFNARRSRREERRDEASDGLCERLRQAHAAGGLSGQGPRHARRDQHRRQRVQRRSCRHRPGRGRFRGDDDHQQGDSHPHARQRNPRNRS